MGTNDAFYDSQNIKKNMEKAKNIYFTKFGLIRLFHKNTMGVKIPIYSIDG